MKRDSGARIRSKIKSLKGAREMFPPGLPYLWERAGRETRLILPLCDEIPLDLFSRCAMKSLSTDSPVVR